MNKTSNVTARVNPEVKQKAEAILSNLGIPISVAIDTLYRQIIIQGGLPYSLTLHKFPSLDNMNKEEFDSMLKTGLDQVSNGEVLSLDDAFRTIDKVD